MSHDIRTPMNAITGITSLLEHDADFQQPVKSVGHRNTGYGIVTNGK